MNRYEELKKILQARKYFKLVCGAGNEDAEEVRRLVVIFTIAGATVFDLSANTDVIKAAHTGISTAYRLASTLDREINTRPFLNVSIGLKGDPHVRKAEIDGRLCTQCGQCLPKCRQEAIGSDFAVLAYRCIGCGDCEAVCEFGAIKYYHKKADFDKLLPECVRLDIETMELHAVTEDDEGVFADWTLLNRLIPDNYLSMCLDRSLLSNKRLVERIGRAYAITGERLIIQADGVPMSGEGDDYRTTLQAVACADIVQKSGIPAMVLLSGGTNSKTGLLARQCGVNAHGVAIGSWARKIVREFVKREDFDSNPEVLRNALAVAEKLIKVNIEALNG